jgi:uncharacterized protein (DUF4415 family)
MKKLKRRAKPGKIGWIQAVADEHYPPEMFREKWGFYKPIKKLARIKLDADVLAWFKQSGRGYQTRINLALRKIMMDQRRDIGE